jgi:hypothetical protein
VIGSLLLFALVVLLLFAVVFPAVEPLLPWSDVTVEPEPAARGQGTVPAG